MQQVIPQSQQQQERRFWLGLWQAIQDLEFISNFFSWFFLLLNRLAEPFMTLSAMYVIVCAGVPNLKVPALYNMGIAILLSAPEVLLPGAFILAAKIKDQGNNKAWMLQAICWGFVVLTIATLASLFIFKNLSDEVLSVIMWARCSVSIAYSILLRIVMHTQKQEQAQQSQQTEAATLVEQLREEMQARDEVMQRQFQEITQAFTAIPAPAPAPAIDIEALAAQITERVTRTVIEQLPAIPASPVVESESHSSRIPRTLPAAKKLKRGKPSQKVSAGDIRERIRAISEAEPDASPQVIGSRLGVTRQTVYNHLKALRSASTGEQQSAEQNSFCELSTKNNGRKTNI